jgi:hypothetical protein
MTVAPPTVRSKEQVAVAKFVLADTLFGEMTFTALLELVNSSSTQVPLFMPRHLQTWYSLWLPFPIHLGKVLFVCRHPDGCDRRV